MKNFELKKIPAPILVIAAPVIGGLFVVAFPLIVIAMVLAAAVKLVFGLTTSLVFRNAHVATMNWSPNAAYLKGRKNRK